MVKDEDWRKMVAPAKHGHILYDKQLPLARKSTRILEPGTCSCRLDSGFCPVSVPVPVSAAAATEIALINY